ncbi:MULTISPECIES: multidrug effflux MFS transporter [Marivita]|uniref:Multidrug effflux MFS transporter n=1 Tax=Marivita cryptomonadis TaxID=505252 RepID=A0A9Q2P861_9RHOB|nr:MULTISPECIES: multidrug effflux MFS transporter [Marivita]MCR9169620.1 multidrug effflux MFS transporter [Paracoccaceae bacterium]MBM2320771.1 multidrug effflux MFS transporter [Marivita cryptomonadis]MBM2330351.1 multidrug effflux MFS transporter [Marivita cryptomonadis]MBM2339938.1 multidrug effflux MFS transporter [Marivita cryptomonadis]MBM2344598.1 multidrug effflux MFS transporter [Marivita cryptomonadis]
MPTAMSRTEFVALMAMLAATVALSIDAMLPALPQIAETLSPDNINKAQLIVTSFVLGMGLGTFVTGPLSDTFGRKPVMLWGSVLYIVGAVVASWAQSLEVLLAARVVQGLGAAGPRVVAMAVIRDLYAGRGMAQIVSFVMIVFSLVPAIAPLLGSIVIDIWDWRAVFYGFVGFSAISAMWVAIRLPETLAPENRRSLRLHALRSAFVEMFVHPVVRISIAVQALSFGMLFGLLSSIQQIFDITFDRAESFPLWFGAVAIVAASSGFLNARLVMRLGMMYLVRVMLLAQVVLSAAMILVATAAAAGHVSNDLYFGAFVVWQVSLFFQAGMTIGNLNAIAQEPMGHIAGMAASVISSVATVFGVALAVPVGLLFDGTPLPLSVAIFFQAALGLALMRLMVRVDARMTT